MLNELICGCCLEFMPQIPTNSIDLILTDLPYGMTARNKWDEVIPFENLWSEYKRILKEAGAVVLNACQPFTSQVVMSNRDWFKYEYIWRKQQGTGFLNAKKQPLRNHESILVFYDKQCKYYPQMRTGFKPYKITRGRETTNYNTTNIPNFTSESDGSRYPLTVLEFNYDKEKLHPTQKPIALIEFLIQTYTGPGDLVLDSTMGSGTTMVGCKNLGRQFIGIEKDPVIFEVAKKRIEAVGMPEAIEVDPQMLLFQDGI